MHRDEQGRTRTKILVQKRSYLDGGTEVMPGDVADHYTNFVYMHQRPTSVISNDNVVPICIQFRPVLPARQGQSLHGSV